MRLARLRHSGRDQWAVLDSDTLVLIDDPWARTPIKTGDVVPWEQASLLAPAAPRTVVGMAHNTGIDDRRLPPQAFLKPARAVAPPGGRIELPKGIGRVDVEGELAVVIARTARHLTRADALDHVLGYTLANDVTARDLQVTDPLWTTAKGADGWTPLGPWIETELDPSDVAITVSVNGAPLRPGSTDGLARDVVDVLVYITSFMTLGPGDVVLTGAPGQSAPVQPGDHVEISAPGLGSLIGTVVGEQTPVPAARRPS